jgi:hypothetical protein
MQLEAVLAENLSRIVTQAGESAVYSSTEPSFLRFPVIFMSKRPLFQPMAAQLLPVPSSQI